MPPAREDAPPQIGWFRAILTAIVVVAVGIAVLVYGTDAVLTKVHSVHRPQRVAIATALFFVVLFAMAWILRRLQRKKLI
jgi:multisubunit Na+/H+ antiporter MnhB subunit